MIKHIIHKLIIQKQKEIPFIIFFWFFISFTISRFIVFLMHTNAIPNLSLIIRDVHVHHLNYGILILSITGYIAIAFKEFAQKYIHTLSAVYGIGLGVAFDEFGMWLLLEDNYWNRYSYDAFIIIILIFLNIIYFKDFWIYIAKQFKKIKSKQLRLFK